MTPNVLTIAGFDPSGGAGILADIKVFEKCQCKGFAVQTSNTIQTEASFYKLVWIDEDIIFHQLKILLEKYHFQGVKIGLMPSVVFLKKVLEMLQKAQPNAKIIWDPITITSSGFQIHDEFCNIEPLLSSLFMVTPNQNEAKYLSKEEPIEDGLKKLSVHTRFLLKGGHNPSKIGVDLLFYKGASQRFNPKKGTYFPKHGSGCVFSAALLCYISKGYPLQKSILKSKRYIERFLASDKNLLGTHYR